SRRGERRHPRHGLGRELPRDGRPQADRPRALPAGDAHDHRGGHRRASGRTGGGEDGDVRRSGARAAGGRARRHRRARVVGPRAPRRRRRRGRGPRRGARPRRDGPRGAPRGDALEAVSAADGDELQPPLARGRRSRARVGRQPGAPGRARPARGVRGPRAGDVRRVLRHPAARGARFPQQLHGRRGLPQRLLLHAREGADLLFQPGARDVPRLPPAGDSPRHRERRRVGPQRAARSRRAHLVAEVAARLVRGCRRPGRRGVVKPPASPHFSALSLLTVFNARREDLPEPLRPPGGDELFGEQVVRGIPFAFGAKGDANVVYLEAAPVTVALGGACATYVLVAHAVEDVATNYLTGFADSESDGNSLGAVVSDYTLRFVGGRKSSTPILRRFAIQQSRIGWGASPFAAVPASEELIVRPVAEQLAAGEPVTKGFGFGECRHASARDSGEDVGLLWIYALPSPSPEEPIEALVLAPRGERSAVYAVTLTDLAEHPLRPGVRQKVRLDLPAGVALNPIGELDDVAADLGTVISARAVLEYDAERWLGDEPSVQPKRSTDAVVVEYVAHPAARLHVGSGEGQVVYELGTPPAGLTVVPASDRPVRVRIVDAETGAPVPVRLHLHGDTGAYLPPRGHHRRVT